MKRKLKVGMRGRCYGFNSCGENINLKKGTIGYMGSDDFIRIIGTDNLGIIHEKQFKPFKQKEQKLKLSKIKLTEAFDECFAKASNYCITSYSANFIDFLKRLGYDE